MRIAILNWSNRHVGGSTTYLQAVIPQLRRAGHELAFWHEVDGPTDRGRIALPSDTPVWSVQALGTEAALAELKAWQPRLLYAHGLLDPRIEARTLDVAPAVFLAHDYYGTCISGAKSFKNPAITPCTRTFGLPCLVQYYPRRCGGWSPLTMVREFRKQADRLALLRRYKAVVTLSTHMQQEYSRHGLSAPAIFKVHCGPVQEIERSATAQPSQHAAASRLLFVGRMHALKGGHELLSALPNVIQALQKDVHLVLVGDGPDRLAWEQLAVRIQAEEPRLRIEFPGWLARDAIDTLFANSDLLVLPSLWPEPFGLVGLEAARHRLPVAAFAVGGISEWLRPGVNGFLADGDPPSARGLAEAIIQCLKDPETHAHLREGASRLSSRLTFDRHVDALLRVFADVTHGISATEGS